MTAIFCIKIELKNIFQSNSFQAFLREGIDGDILCRFDQVDLMSLGVIDPWECEAIQSGIINWRRSRSEIPRCTKFSSSTTRVHEWLHKNSKYLPKEQEFSPVIVASEPLKRKEKTKKDRLEVAKKKKHKQNVVIERRSKGSEPVKRKKKPEKKKKEALVSKKTKEK